MGGGTVLFKQISETADCERLPRKAEAAQHPPIIRSSELSPFGLATRARPFHVVFDVSDSINYFRSARLPTGIQRVQIELVEYAIRDASFDFSIACFTKESNYWIEIPRDLFESLCALSVGDFGDSAWTEVAARLEGAISSGRPFQFPFGGILLNLGSSWWLQNYFLGVRAAKVHFDILYVPFIHDLIPMAMPELCVAELRNNFEEWIDSVFAHADFFLVNSQNTLADLRTAARQAGAEREAAVITLDADFRNAPTAGEEQPKDDPRAVLKELGLEPGQFVLFVSTIEPRKNHALVFAAWLKLLRRHGPEKCPKLVCVGQRGWLNSEVYLRLAASDVLMRHVLMLSNISDTVLGKLYDECICTLYPSMYEGWGLPVTESLCFGKVPVVSHVASLPEAGGDFAEYFDVNSERALLESIEHIVFDSDHRLEREHKIKCEFHPRGWQEIGAQIIRQLRSWTEQIPLRARQVRRGDCVSPLRAETGCFYSLAGEIQGARGYARRGEIFRSGKGWWWPEPWGCWMRGEGPATLAFALEDPGDARIWIYLGLRGVQGREGIGVIRTSEQQRLSVRLLSEEEKIVSLTLEPGRVRQRQIALDFTSDVVADFRPSTEGRDFRVCGLGIKWFFLCRENDMKARVDLIDMVLTEEAAWIGCKAAVEVDALLAGGAHAARNGGANGQAATA